MDAARRQRLLSDLRRDSARRESGYRDRALRLFPHVCARCARALGGKRLRELTVHHRDGDHNHNPPDGSNWELLCLYCHDHEHEKSLTAGQLATGSGNEKPASGGFSAFDNLDALLGRKNETPG
jgi:hypothetical protein